MNHLAVRQNMITVGLVLFAFLWVFESGIDALVFDQGNLVDQILRPDANEIWMRSVVGLCIIVFSFYAQTIIRRLSATRAELQGANEKLEIRVSERTAELETANTKLKNDFEEHRHTEEAFKILFESTIAVTGPEFFDTLASSLSGWLDVDCVIIGQIDDDETVHVLAMRLDGKPVYDYSHRLSGTTLRDSLWCCCRRGILFVF